MCAAGFSPLWFRSTIGSEVGFVLSFLLTATLFLVLVFCSCRCFVHRPGIICAEFFSAELEVLVSRSTLLLAHRGFWAPLRKQLSQVLAHVLSRSWAERTGQVTSCAVRSLLGLIFPLFPYLVRVACVVPIAHRLFTNIWCCSRFFLACLLAAVEVYFGPCAAANAPVFHSSCSPVSGSRS
jgi:hypothetical protein